MRNIMRYIPFFLLNSLIVCYTIPAKAQQTTTSAAASIQHWMTAWELVSDHIFHLSPTSAPELLFFDDTYSYTTSATSAPNGTPFKGPAFRGKQLPWRVAPYRDSLILPNATKVPVGLMSFAAPFKNGNGFFVMGTPPYWEKAGIQSQELGLKKMLTGVFLHEFAHTRQFNGIGRLVDSIEQQHAFTTINLTDDIVQDYFKKDSIYVREFQQEVNKFYEAAFTTDNTLFIKLVKEALSLLRQRQAKYFTGEKAVLKPLDDIFLSMEGLGQYTAVRWLIHPRGGNLSFDTAVEGFRRKRNQWSQEEGLAMYLVLNKLAPPDWEHDIFGSQPRFITDLLEAAVNSRQ
ncbi:hypothetical protein [Chitinophaga nivalis]|uniref:Aminopeptidase n=1 Tax=Chitinophaga nivalis TaxID=2991709 RepID=A0ABT3IUS5_9BACT|nr:hypothetical protein [Chitinophaga nivalis]MCW3462581.1 hypothetical protein [Chitinophaga nivalis]MCW3487728.1 hypothetical protein [Chitinophaga nivalis]